MQCTKVLPITLALVLLAACAPTRPVAGTVDFESFRGELNMVRQAVQPWTEAEKALLLVADPDPALLTDDEISALVTPVEEGQSVLPAESAADVDLFFRAMKSAYGAYDYLGGDAVFLPIRAAILTELTDKPPLTGSSIGRVIAKHLSPVIRDNHFTIDGQPLMALRSKMYYVPNLYFGPEAGGPERYVKPTIGPDGALAWCFAALSTDGADLPKTGTVDGKEVPLDWTPAPDFAPKTTPAYERADLGGVPVLVCRTLSAEADPQGVNALADSGMAWRDAPLLVADLRGNGGGNAMYAMEWFRGYADSDPAVKTLFLQNCSRLFSTAARTYADSGRFADQVAANAGTWEISRSEGGQITSSSAVFILQDGATASSGESFVSYLASLENTVAVGSNTMGCSLSENIMELCLPKSGVKFRFGSSLNLCGTTQNTEGIGLLPDLWVPPREAEDAVLRLIRYYGLN